MREDYARSNDRITCGCARCLSEKRLLLALSLATWHTAQPNTSKLERWNTIQGYHSGAITAHGGTPTGPMMGDEMLLKLAELGRLTPTKRCATTFAQCLHATRFL